MKLRETQSEEDKKTYIIDGLIWILYLFPIIATFWLIKRFGVNVPIWVDQFALVDLFEAVANINVLSFFRELWELNNNHRMIFPKLIFAVTAFLSNWNIFYELYWSFGLALASFLVLYKISEITQKNTSIFLFHTINIITCFLVFSWVQYRNWLWGFQLALYLINFCVIIAVFILTNSENFQSSTKLKLAGIFCGIASFSSAQGLMSWLALIPSILTVDGSEKQKKKHITLWIFSFLICCLIYSIQYQATPITESYDTLTYDSIWGKLYVYIHFFLNVVAAPLTGSSAVAWIFGLIIVSLFTFLVFRFGIEQVSIFRPFRVTFIPESSPWISIGFFSILCGFLITIGRADFGVEYGLTTSRYTTHAILLVISVIHLLNIHLFHCQNHLQQLKFNDRVLAYCFGLGLITSLIWVRATQSLDLAKTLVYQPTKVAEECLYLIDYMDVKESNFFDRSSESCLIVMTPQAVGLSDEAKRLQKINLRDFAEDISFVEEPDQVYGFISSPWTYKNSLTVPTAGIVEIDGWAVFPNQLQQPQLVFLSLNDRQSFFANAFINLPSPDVIEFLESEHYRNSRWEVSFSADNLSPGENEIKAWVFDPIERQFMKLSGQMKVTVEPNQNIS